MKTTVKIIAFSEYALLSQEGKLSILGIFDRVHVEKFPGGIARAFFVTEITTEPNAKATFALEGKLGNKVIFPAVKVEAKVNDSGSHNWIVDFAGLGFPEAGDYKFVLSQDDKEIGSTVLHVVPKHYETKYKLPN